MNSNGDKSGWLGEVKASNLIAGIPIYGPTVDSQTRCIHYHSPTDIIAIKFKCCDRYYPCYSCHDESENHPVKQWGKEERTIKAIICGVCGHEMTINEYFGSANQCPSCQSDFNPNCSKHYSYYFVM